jgi:uncharacterized SAM-binding protein YcdF (DUF218 family)
MTNPEDIQRIGDYMMPTLPASRSDLGFLFGTRHGIPEFCDATLKLWQAGMFKHLLVSGGRTGTLERAEAEIIGEELVRLGVPESALILECAAMNTGENVCFGRRKVAERLDIKAIRSVIVIGKIFATRRYLMTLQRHWPGLRMSVYPVNYLGVAAQHWHENAAFRTKVLDEFSKIPTYMAQGFLEEISDGTAYPSLVEKTYVR